MAKEKWQVWREYNFDPVKEVLFEGTEKQCWDWFNKNGGEEMGLHIGFIGNPLEC
jgi:hypothetical protein